MGAAQSAKANATGEASNPIYRLAKTNPNTITPKMMQTYIAPNTNGMIRFP